MTIARGEFGARMLINEADKSARVIGKVLLYKMENLLGSQHLILKNVQIRRYIYFIYFLSIKRPI